MLSELSCPQSMSKSSAIPSLQESHTGTGVSAAWQYTHIHKHTQTHKTCLSTAANTTGNAIFTNFNRLHLNPLQMTEAYMKDSNEP